MAEKLRVDKWLWYGRFFKTRSLAAARVTAGDVRLNGLHLKKPSAQLVVGDVLTFMQGRRVRVVKVAELGTRRGPAPEAQALYRDMSPPEVKSEEIVPSVPTFEGKGRPTKRDRRRLDLSKARSLE